MHRLAGATTRLFTVTRTFAGPLEDYAAREVTREAGGTRREKGWRVEDKLRTLRASRKVPPRAALFLVPHAFPSLAPSPARTHFPGREVEGNSHAWPLKMYVISRAYNLTEKRASVRGTVRSEGLTWRMMLIRCRRCRRFRGWIPPTVRISVGILEHIGFLLILSLRFFSRNKSYNFSHA